MPQADRSQLSVRLAALLAAAAVLQAAAAQSGRDEIEEALDQTVAAFRIERSPIRDALNALGRHTRLNFSVADGVVDLLPYGGRTAVTIELKDISVRRGLGQIFDGLGLSLRVADGKVLIESAPVLRRLGRRMTIDEAGVLALLAREPWSAVRQRGIPLQYQIDPSLRPADALERALAQAPSDTAIRQLDTACAALGWVWMPRDKAVVFHTRRDHVADLLNRPLAFKYAGVAIDAVLQDIGRRSGVRVAFDPGVLERVAQRAGPVHFEAPRRTPREVLDLLCGRVGMQYEIIDDGIRVFDAPAAVVPASATGGNAPAGTTDTTALTAPPEPATGLALRIPRVVALIRNPLNDKGVSIDFPVYEDELPPDIRQLREDKIREVIEEARRILASRAGSKQP